MRCLCAELPDAFYLDAGPPGFEGELTREDSGAWSWLGACPACGALWAVDEPEKYEAQVVTRVPSRDDFPGLDTTERRRQLLLASRGGLSDEPCIWAGCDRKAVRGVVYCLDHLWETGARR